MALCRRCGSIVCCLIACAAVCSADVSVPPDDFADGWKRSDELLQFVGHDLYGHINGGAELFHEFGFERLLVQRYAKGDNEIDLEIYQMTEPTAALGIYLMKCGAEETLPGLEVRHSGGESQIVLVRDRYLIQINNFLGDIAVLPTMILLAESVTADLPTNAPLPLVDSLPTEDLIENSVRIVRGLYGLQPIYTFGKGDILSLGGKTYGVVGDYESAEGKTRTAIVIQYPSEDDAKSAFDHLVGNLDSYLKVLAHSDAMLVFSDYRSMFGSIELQEKTLDIQVNLSEEPKLD